jgi:predicted RNA binding protein YcfA (HicA-like mRNA interferase family)
MTPKDIIKELEARGFLLKRINGSHHIFQHPDSKKVTVVPMHKKDHFMPFLSNPVLKGMILDEPLTPDFIYSFGVPPAFKCSMDKFVQHYFS